MPTQYDFTTRWMFKAPLAEVWDAIYRSQEWPQWWKGVLSVTTLAEGDAQGIGGVRQMTWKSVLPYRLTFNIRMTGMERHRHLKGEAFGELEGTGEWWFEEKDGITSVRYHWTVITRKAWMNVFSFLLKPAFRYNHDVVMRWGGEGLARKLHTELLPVTSELERI